MTEKHGSCSHTWTKVINTFIKIWLQGMLWYLMGKNICLLLRNDLIYGNYISKDYWLSFNKFHSKVSANCLVQFGLWVRNYCSHSTTTISMFINKWMLNFGTEPWSCILIYYLKPAYLSVGPLCRCEVVFCTIHVWWAVDNILHTSARECRTIARKVCVVTRHSAADTSKTLKWIHIIIHFYCFLWWWSWSVRVWVLSWGWSTWRTSAAYRLSGNTKPRCQFICGMP
jgi:hypothetical protein